MGDTIINPSLQASSCAFKPGSSTVITVQSRWRWTNTDIGGPVEVSVVNDMSPGIVDMDQAWWDATYAMAATAIGLMYPTGVVASADPVTV